MAIFTPLVLLLASTLATAQNTSTYPIFNLDARPTALYADLVTYIDITTSGGSNDYTATYSVSCFPTDRACAALSIYPAVIYHTQGSIFGGTTTARPDDSTTEWECNLASGKVKRPDCKKTITYGRQTVNGEPRVETVSTVLDDCYIFGHSVAMVVTKGAEQYGDTPYLTRDVAGYNSGWNEYLSENSCPPIPFDSVVQTASTDVVTSSSSAAATTTSQTASAGAHVASSGSPSVTGSTTSNTAGAAGISASAATTSSRSSASQAVVGNLWLVAFIGMSLSFVQ